MFKKMKFLFSSMLLLTLLFGLSPPAQAESGYDLVRSYAPQETAVFIDGSIKVLEQKTYLADDDNLYVPVKLLNNLQNIKITYDKNIVVTSNKGNLTINKTNSLVYKNSTYITLSKFLAITGYSAKHLKDGASVFIWSDNDGYTKSYKIINNLIKSPDGVKSYLGSKVFVYKSNKVGWVIDVKYVGFGLTDVTILLNNGDTIQESIFQIQPSTFCTFDQYQLIKTGYSGKYYWANSNKLPSSSPLHNIEKVYFNSLDLKDDNLVIKVTRANGNPTTLTLPLHGYPSSDLYDGFYSQNPKSIHPDWSQAVWDIIAGHRVALGMNEEQVLMSWGNPNDINSYHSSNKTMEQWVYEHNYLYFYDGKLNSLSSH
ncbi:hypothetical protein [Paenibacillus sp. FSL H3-0286]|uniref:hypothetical protein n=1 Tax=Paenibacillus sp. FSL H3-0286 TaxID=2921427 RepID=UPI0032490942